MDERRWDNCGDCLLCAEVGEVCGINHDLETGDYYDSRTLHPECPLRKGHVLIKLKQEEVEVV